MSTTPESEPYNTGKRNAILKQVVDGQQNFSHILHAELRGNFVRLDLERRQSRRLYG